MEATQVSTPMTRCCGSLPDLEGPMINAMVSCLGSEHRKLDDLNMQLAFAATRLARDPDAVTANQRALQVWDQIRHDLWSHLQIEDELVFSWGEAHHAISDTLLDSLKSERQEMRKLMAALREPHTVGDRSSFAHTLLALARTLDSHVEHYDGEVLPSILRELFPR
ncbi:MAG: hemerythrin domain-containing protein [Candidatus Binataceae bacterium]